MHRHVPANASRIQPTGRRGRLVRLVGGPRFLQTPNCPRRLREAGRRLRRSFPASKCHRQSPYRPCPHRSHPRWLDTLVSPTLSPRVSSNSRMLRNRMLGKTTLFVPGFDHAGISTQSVVERRLFKQEGKTRHDLGREAFLEKVMDWKNEFVFCSITTRSYLTPCSYQSRITNQLRRLGGSFDWDRVAFTMSPVSSRCHSSHLTYLHLSHSQKLSSRTFASCTRVVYCIATTVW